jgi:hypothetical protein
MKPILALLAPAVAVLAGCYSVPVVDLSPGTEPPLNSAEIERMNRAGLADEVVLEAIERRGIAEADELESNHPVFGRELCIPWWPWYSAGRWRWGVRFSIKT